MIDLSRIDASLFDDEENISMANFQEFMSDHFDRMVGLNPDDKLTPIITASQPVFNQFKIVFGSKSVEEALKKGATIGFVENVGQLLKAARKLEKRVAHLYDVGSPTYVAFFPLGLNELNHAGKGEWPLILKRLAVATDTHSTELEGTLAADWAEWNSKYLATESYQVGKKGTVDRLRSQLRIDRKAVARQLFINLLTIALLFVDAPGKVTAYFDQTIVDRKKAASRKKGEGK